MMPMAIEIPTETSHQVVDITPPVGRRNPRRVYRSVSALPEAHDGCLEGNDLRKGARGHHGHPADVDAKVGLPA
jgi:hypothetical protein